MKKYYQLLKDLHFYAALFISPFVIVFSISVLVLNHDIIDWQDDWQEWFFSVNENVDERAEFTMPAPDKSDIGYARDILKQVHISGEIAGVFRDSIQMYIPVTKPGDRISIRADLISGTAFIHRDKTSLWKKLIWLHKMPGPHNANIRGNWMFTKIWGTLSDLFVIFLLFSSLTGIILWIFFKNEKTIGIIALVIGFLSIATLVIGLTI